MSQKRKPVERCDRCYMRLELCFCAEIPSISLATKVVVVVSKREFLIPTNTGRLAVEALANSVILQRGDLEAPYELSEHLGPEGTNFVFYPSDDAIVLSPEMALPDQPCTLIFPDGNWRGAGKMCRRDPVMARLPKVKLPPGPPTNYRVRKETKTEGLATIEAIARALGILEGPEPQVLLEGALNTMADRTLQSRGVIGCDRT